MDLSEHPPARRLIKASSMSQEITGRDKTDVPLVQPIGSLWLMVFDGISVGLDHFHPEIRPSALRSKTTPG